MRLSKNVVAQFIGRLCLMNQATTKMPEIERKIKIKQSRIEKEVMIIGD